MTQAQKNPSPGLLTPSGISVVELPLKQWRFLWSWENWGVNIQIEKGDNLRERLEVWILSIRWLHSNDPMTISDRPFQDDATDHLIIKI